MSRKTSMGLIPARFDIQGIVGDIQNLSRTIESERATRTMLNDLLLPVWVFI
jgi:hypothetical protein